MVKSSQEKGNQFYKTLLLQLMAGEHYDFFSEDELCEMFGLTDEYFTKENYYKYKNELISLFNDDIEEYMSLE